MRHNIDFLERNTERNKGFFTRLLAMPAYLLMIIITSAFSIIGFIIFALSPPLASYFILTPKEVLSGNLIWTLLTHLFLHANFFHLFVNMFSLFFIGSLSEMIIGKKRFILFYLTSGIVAGLFFVFAAFLGSEIGLTSVLGSIDIGGVGASGILFGFLGILGVLIPHKEVYLIVGPIIVFVMQIVLTPFLPVPIANIFSLIISIVIFLMLFSLFFQNKFLQKLAIPVRMSMSFAPFVAIVPLVIVSFYINLPISNTAHFGGLIVGLIYGFYLRLKYRKKVGMIRRLIR